MNPTRRVAIVGAAPGAVRPCPLPEDAWWIAADGGAAACLSWGVVPGLVIGDGDSLDPQVAEELRRRGVAFRHYPRDKDATDLELALDEALNRGAEEIDLFGVLGGRWDHSLANVLLPARPAYAAARIQAPGEEQSLYWLRPGRLLELSGHPGRSVSLLPLGGEARAVTTSGLRFPLDRQTLAHGDSRGMSNVMTGERATVRLEAGVLLAVGPPGGQQLADG
ncbi:MAG TPA: thiamine diphosphokinase [Acidobacteria bacterium]|nr:thiamine diphosphokinase [Acidobacteriota bacterium]